MFSFYSIYKEFEDLYKRGIKVVNTGMLPELPDYVGQLFSFPDQRVVSAGDVAGVERREFAVLGVRVVLDFVHLGGRGNAWKKKRMAELCVWTQRALFFLLKWAGVPVDKLESRDIHVVLANSPLKKVVPGVCLHRGQGQRVCGEADVYTAFNVNSGLTTFSAGIGPVSNKVLVYRDEEMVKVLVHELVHRLRFDFSYWEYEAQEEALKAAFPLWCRPIGGSRVALSECFTDTVACWLVAHFFVLYGQGQSKSANSISLASAMTERTYLRRVARVLALQHEYMVNQAAKITREYAAGRVVGEKTHVFSYFIAKAAIFGMPGGCEYVLARWHPSKRFNKGNWVAFYAYVTRAVKSRMFKKALSIVEPCVEKTVGKEGMRMQRIEL